MNRDSGDPTNKKLSASASPGEGRGFGSGPFSSGKSNGNGRGTPPPSAIGEEQEGESFLEAEKHRKKSDPLTLKDRLSRLSFAEAAKLLGPKGKEFLRSGNYQDFGLSDVEANFKLSDDLLEIIVYGSRVSFFLSGPNGVLGYSCEECGLTAPEGCEHVAAVMSLILEEKTALGLAAPPPERIPLERLSEEDLVERAISERKERVLSDALVISSVPRSGVWGDYQVDNPKTGRAWKVSVRGIEKGKTFCECPDFKTNTLGLCKHTLAVEAYLQRSGKNLKRYKPWEPTEVEVSLNYLSRPLALRVEAPNDLPRGALKDIRPLLGRPVTEIQDLVKTIGNLERRGIETNVFPDALEHIELCLYRDRIKSLTDEIRRNHKTHPLRQNLLKTELLPYQLDGVAFAAGAGRAIIADEMGLGKTIQGVGLAELLAREAGIRKVLIVCPASLKAQWEDEIRKFSRRSVTRVLGTAKVRAEQYRGENFFTICNYEQVARDKRHAVQTFWDLLILDEAQRIKNWETASHRAVAQLKSKHLLILTGTPLENSLGELYTLVKLVDNQILGPAFRFLNAHKETDEKGKLLAWRGLNEVKKALSPVFLRRTRAEVMNELPPRQTEIIRVPATAEQKDIHDTHLKTVSRIVSKPYLTEMDFLRIQKHLLFCRLAANSTILVEKNLPGKSGKLSELKELLERLSLEEERKVIIFSEWTSMLNLVEPILSELNAKWARLDGKIPQTKRKAVIQNFTENKDVKFFLATNAGSTGLNLQAADTIVNLDLPWNPALLEQRIGRAHRIGQTRKVQVYLLVTADTIEERLLDVLGAKSALAMATLDLGSDVDFVTMTSGIDALKSRLEILLGRKPDKPIEEPPPAPVQETQTREYKRKISEAGGKLFSAVCEFIGELLPQDPPEKPKDGEENGEVLITQAQSEEEKAPKAPGEAIKDYILSCVQKDEEGRPRFTFTLPDDKVIDKVANVVSQFLGGGFWKK